MENKKLDPRRFKNKQTKNLVNKKEMMQSKHRIMLEIVTNINFRIMVLLKLF